MIAPIVFDESHDALHDEEHHEGQKKRKEENEQNVTK